jgi:hypothetical protein
MSLTNGHDNDGFVNEDGTSHVLSDVNRLRLFELQVGDQHSILVPVSEGKAG